MKTSEAKTFLDDVVKGFSFAQKQLSPKYFYDELGAKIFERICTTPEYPTRTETRSEKTMWPKLHGESYPMPR